MHYKVYCQSSGSGSFNATHRKYFSINGSVIIDWTGNISAHSPNAYIGIAEGDLNNIPHNADGTKVIGFGALIQGTSYGIYAEKWENFTLTTIPRASTVTCTSGNIGESVTITINKASSNFTHTLTYSFGSLSGTIATKTANATYGFTIPTTFYAQIPNAKSGVCTITCQTYNGNTSMGSKTCTFTATASEAACQPTLSVSIADVNSTTTALTGNSSKLVMNLSTARVSITTAAKNSATIASKVVNDISVSGTSVDIANVTSSSFTITVTDSRGYSNSLTMTPTVVNYIPLTINATLSRNNPTDNKVNLTYTGNYFNASFGSVTNTLTLKWYYREKGATSWTTGGNLSPTKSGNTYSNGSSATSLGSVFNYQKQYEIKLEAKDKATTLEPIYQISQGLPVFNWGADFFNVNGNVSSTGNMSVGGNASVTGNMQVTGNVTASNLTNTSYGQLDFSTGATNFTRSATTMGPLHNNGINFTLLRGNVVMVILTVGGVYNTNTGYTAFFDIQVDKSTYSTSGEKSATPADWGSNWSQGSDARTRNTMIFFFTGLSVGQHNFRPTWRSGNSSVTATIGAYARISMQIVEL